MHCSTIGASGLNFSVRNGKRWDTTAQATWFGVDISSTQSGTPLFYALPSVYLLFRHSERFRAISSARLWRRRLWTCTLSTSSSLTALYGALISRLASHLDAFSAYPAQTRIPGDAPGGTTGTPEVCPSRSSRTSDGTAQNSRAHDR